MRTKRPRKYFYDEDPVRRCNVIATVTFIGVILILVLCTLRSCTYRRPPVHATKATTAGWQYETFFRRHNSPEPQRMAQAVLQTDRPRLMAALAVAESNGNPRAIGDSGKAHGAFQVWPSYHGRVHHDPTAQAVQAERILEELIGDEPRGRLLQALSAYNTGSYTSRTGHRYAQRVIKLMREVRV